MHFNLINKRKKQLANNDGIQKAVQEHWPDDPIDLEYLVREKWIVDDTKKRLYKYIVFVNKNLDIDWITSDNSYDRYSSQICQASALESIPHNHLPEKQIIAFKMLIGEAVVSFLEGNESEATKNIENAKQYVADRLVECSRKWILTIATCIVVLICIADIVVLYSFPSFLYRPQNVWICSCYWSIIGTYLSIVRRAGKNTFDSSAGLYLHFLRVSTQMLSGAFLGIVSFLILKTPYLCPPFFQTLNESITGFCLFAFLAGFAERFIPNIITSLQKKGEQNE